ncbi:MAG: hypothetical protein JO172_01080, partial [Hyphomicrobiales bacterium]|nr:hypothetical protein [Hyphomicrobiales bacterium]
MIRKLLAFFLLLGGPVAGGAFAADLDTVPAPLVVPRTDFTTYLGTGWYIRGDIGYSRPQGPSGTYNGAPFDHLSVAGSAVLGG